MVKKIIKGAQLLSRLDKNEIEFNEYLIQMRSIFDLTQKKLEEITGIPYRNIQNWEEGSRTPPKWNQLIIANHLLNIIPTILDEEKYTKGMRLQK